jgi:catechol 2,3-dioxygenase-like lactoylglutathione lyase family enzyme
MSNGLRSQRVTLMKKDERPPMWLGHIAMQVPDVAAAKAFFLELGMRDVLPDAEEFAILELRAGTHLIVENSKAKVDPDTIAPFDLMVDDVEAMHGELSARGLDTSPLDVGSIHTSFTVAEPNGFLVKYNSSHNTGLPV